MNSASLSLISEALSHAGEDQQLMELLSHLEQRRITPDKELPPMEFLFRLFGRPCFPRGELVALTGRPKSGKTFVSSILMSLCFREEVLSMNRESPEPLHVLWYDTEQSDESTQDILKNRIMEMIGPPPPKGEVGFKDQSSTNYSNLEPGSLNIFNVRQDAWTERLPMLEAAVERFKPDLVILDGIRDLVNDINDGVLAQDTIERLMHLATEVNCCMVCILHQNKSAEDKNLRGWIGTELTHKAFEVYECEKDSNRIFSLKQALTRKYDILDTLKYIVDENGIPQLATAEEIIENEQRLHNTYRPVINRAYFIGMEGNIPILNLPLLFSEAMPEESARYRANDLQENVMKLANITSIFFYNRLREQALEEGIIKKTADEFRHICYYRPKNEVPETPKVEKPKVVEEDMFGEPPGDVPF